MPITLLYPFGATAPGYQAGISIAKTGSNTSAISFSFHPQNGPTFNYTAAAGSAGTGQNPATALLASGGTYTVSLSKSSGQRLRKRVSSVSSTQRATLTAPMH